MDGTTTVDYGQLYADHRLLITVVFGYDDQTGANPHHLSGPRWALYNLYKGGLGLRKVSIDELKSLNIPTGNHRFGEYLVAQRPDLTTAVFVADSRVRTLQGDLDPSAPYNGFLVRNEYVEAITGNIDEVVIYIGHSRHGRGPDFGPKGVAIDNIALNSEGDRSQISRDPDAGYMVGTFLSCTSCNYRDRLRKVWPAKNTEIMCTTGVTSSWGDELTDLVRLLMNRGTDKQIDNTIREWTIRNGEQRIPTPFVKILRENR